MSRRQSGMFPNQRVLCQITMDLLFMQTLGCTDRLSAQSAEEAAIERALRYIEENYCTGSLAQVAARLHYDLCWLSCEIKRRTGKTHKDLFQERRLTQAAYSLKHTRMRVGDVGEAVGYSNISYFYRIFQGKYGVPLRGVSGVRRPPADEDI